MVGHNAERLGGRLVVVIVLAGQLGNLRNDVRERVRLVDRLAAVEGADRALKAHAGIHVLLRHRHILAIGGLVILHEHVVPDFQEAAAGAGRRAVRAARRLILDDKHLGIRAARAGLARRAPPVMLAREEVDVLLLHAVLHPVVGGFVVARDIAFALKHGERKLVLVETEVLRAGQELPAPSDHFLFEIVAQRPVAQHLEERQVGRVAHLVDIARADALLHVGQARAGRMLAAQQIRNERVHARGGEQNGRVVFRNDGSARNHGMALALKEIEPHAAQFAGSHLLHGEILSFDGIQIFQGTKKRLPSGDEQTHSRYHSG